MQHKQALRHLNTPHYRYWQALYRSFFDAKLYLDVGKRWKKLSVGYLFLLVFLLSLPYAWHLILIFDDFFQHKIIEPLQKIPLLYVQNGKVSIDEPQPYLITNNKGEVIIIVDTSGKITQLDSHFPQLFMLITKDKMIYRPLNPPLLGNYQTSQSAAVSKDIPPHLNQLFDIKRWLSSSKISMLRIVSEIFIYPTLGFGLFAVFFIVTLGLAMMAQFVARSLFKKTLSYAESFRLLMVASTPTIVILLLLLANDWTFTGLGFLLIALWAAYFSFAVIVLKRAGQGLVLW